MNHNVEKWQSNNINVWCIALTYGIATLHFATIPALSGLAVLVEWFFIVSGYLLARSFEKHRLSTKDFVLLRYKRLWPEYLFAFVIYMTAKLVYTLYTSTDIFSWLQEIIYSVPEIGMLQVFGFGEFSTNHGAVWYVSVLLVCSVLIYACLKWNKGVFQILAPIVAVCGYLVIYFFNGSIVTGWDSSYGILSNLSFLRGLSSMLVGSILFYGIAYLENARGIPVHLRPILCLLEVIFYLLALILVLLQKNSWFVFLMLLFGVCLSFMKIHPDINSIKIVKILMPVSYAIYLNHALFVDFGLVRHLGFNTAVSYVVYIVMITVYSILTNKLV